VVKLYYCETLNPRKVCAVARHLKLDIEFKRIDLSRGEQREPAFLALNPNGKVPVLEEGKRILWESNAIMCRLSELAGSDLWPHDERQIEVVRWLCWDNVHFSRAAGALYFEYLIKPLFGGTPDGQAVQKATKDFKTAAAVLEGHLKQRRYLVDDALSVADFATAISLPYAERAHLPLQEFPAIAAWHERLNELFAWRQPYPEGSPGFA
jgi:glutathione S-transferase